MSTKVQPIDNSQHDAKLDVIRWLGECIFPQPIIMVVKRFGEKLIVECANEGLIIKSQSKVGIDPTMMRKPKGYLELSPRGWDMYEKLTGEAIV